MIKVKKLLSWIWEGKFIYLFIGIIFLLIYLKDIPIDYPLNDKIILYGSLLQIFGAITIIISLIEKISTFRKGLIPSLIDYFKRFPLFRKSKVLDAQSTIHGHTTINAEVHAVKKPKEELADIIRYIDENVDFLKSSMGKTKQELKTEIADLRVQLSTLNQVLNKETNEMKKLIETTSVSNIWGELFGAICVIFGLILATIPDIVIELIYK